VTSNWNDLQPVAFPPRNSPNLGTAAWKNGNFHSYNMPVASNNCEKSDAKHLYAVNPTPDPLTLKIQTSLAMRQEGLQQVQSDSQGRNPLVLPRAILPRDWQLSAARELLERRDLFVVTATGSGKSLCYQLALIASPGKSILAIFPLISLMTDQVSALVATANASPKYIRVLANPTPVWQGRCCATSRNKGMQNNAFHLEG